jgi:hypothetical protein
MLLLISTPLFAQEVTDVNKHIDKLKVYEKVVEDGYGTSYVYTELANGYYFKSEYEKAKKWFEELFKADEKQLKSEKIRRRYQQTLKALSFNPEEVPFLQANTVKPTLSLQANDQRNN